MKNEISTATLKNELNRKFITKCEANPSYSLRAYARDLKIDATLLSRLMKGQRQFSSEMVQRIVSELNLPLETVRQSQMGKVLNEVAFNAISKWYFFVILELFSIPKFKSDAKWISKRIGLGLVETHAALQVLSDAGHIDMSKKRWALRTLETTWVNYNTTSRDRANYQKQLLDKAKNAIDEIDFSQRENSSLTLAADSKLVPEIKQKIENFKNELREFIESHGKPDEVYQVVISYFPLTKNNNEQEIGAEK